MLLKFRRIDVWDSLTEHFTDLEEIMAIFPRKGVPNLLENTCCYNSYAALATELPYTTK